MRLRFLSPLHRAIRQLTVCLGPRIAPLDVGSEGHLLSYLRSYAPCPVGELRRVFGIKRSTLTSMLDRIEERGYVTRVAADHDRRSLLVSLTPDGRTVADRLEVILRGLEDEIHGRISARDLQGFDAVMAAIDDVTRVELRPKEDR